MQKTKKQLEDNIKIKDLLINSLEELVKLLEDKVELLAEYNNIKND